MVFGALVAGGTANLAIDRHPRDRLRMAVREDAKDAVTHYRLRKRFRSHTALECRLETGRTHQIRVHLAHLKYPIIGDPLYGGSRACQRASEELIACLRASSGKPCMPKYWSSYTRSAVSRCAARRRCRRICSS